MRFNDGEAHHFSMCMAMLHVRFSIVWMTTNEGTFEREWPRNTVVLDWNSNRVILLNKRGQLGDRLFQGQAHVKVVLWFLSLVCIFRFSLLNSVSKMMFN
jgi:hypothetical protein